MNRNRVYRGDKLLINNLRYDIEWVVRHWGYFETENTCKYFEYVVELLKEKIKGEQKLSKSSKKIGVLPEEKEKSTAKDFDFKSTDDIKEEN